MSKNYSGEHWSEYFFKTIVIESSWARKMILLHQCVISHSMSLLCPYLLPSPLTAIINLYIWYFYSKMYLFLPREATILARSWDRNLSVRPPVCHMRALWRNERPYWQYCGYFDTTWKGDHSSSLIPTEVGGRLKWPIPFEKRQHWPISAYDLWTEKYSIVANRKSTTCFPTSYRWIAYVTPNSQKGGPKSKFVVFVNTIQVQSNKVCYKVSLCEKL